VSFSWFILLDKQKNEQLPAENQPKLCYSLIMIIGAHVSIAGGFDKSIDRALDIGANAVQTFASSPRSLKYSELPGDIIEKYKQKKANSSFGPHFFHGVYLVNLATEKKDYLKVSIDSLIHYQKTAGQISGEGTIFHIGSHKGVGFDAVKDQVVNAVNQVLDKTPDGVTLFLENAAGHKGVIGSDLNELGWIVDNVDPNLKSKLAICIDTQHAFASGYDLRTKQGIDQLIRDSEKAFGWDKVKVIHANDSIPEFHSHKDRHQNIGEGEIGEAGFKLILNHPKLSDLPFLLEVPGESKSGPRKIDLEKLKSLIK
jgi:deoxyribonuclease-4